MKFLMVWILLLVWASTKASNEIDADIFSQKFANLFINYWKTNNENDILKEMKNDLNRNDTKLIGFSKYADFKYCLWCYIAVNGILRFEEDQGFGDSFKDFSNKLCIYIGVFSPKICEGQSEIYYSTIKFIFENNRNLTAENVCNVLVQGFYGGRNELDYEGIPVEKPILMGSKKSFIESTENFTILHLTDFHYDPYYQAGSNAECEEWICCRGPKIETDSKLQAGYWGEYRPCDSPDYLLNNLIENVGLNFKKIDWIYFTGDYVDHFAWDMTKEHCKKSIKYVIDLVKENFPGVPVYPTLGNHESYPANLYAPSSIEDPNLSTRWLYEFVADLWEKWLPKEAIDTLRKDGYYTVLVRPNFRVIVLNSNVCFVSNLWLLYDNFFFRDQLEWLHDVLRASSLANEKVHILAHVPSNDVHCYRSWTKEYKKIIERYSHIIVGQFNGHSHLDEFVVFYATEDPSVALNVAWNGGSATTFQYLNSNYKVFYVDNQSYEILDFETWYFNLTEANLTPDQNPNWIKSYSFKNHFNLTDLSPFSINELIEEMSVNEVLLEKYWKTVIKNSDILLQEGCNVKCLRNTLTSATRTDFDDGKNYTINSKI